MIRSRFRLFQGDVKIRNFFSQGITVEAEQCRGLYLIASGLPQC